MSKESQEEKWTTDPSSIPLTATSSHNSFFVLNNRSRFSFIPLFVPLSLICLHAFLRQLSVPVLYFISSIVCTLRGRYPHVTLLIFDQHSDKCQGHTFSKGYKQEQRTGPGGAQLPVTHTNGQYLYLFLDLFPVPECWHYFTRPVPLFRPILLNREIIRPTQAFGSSASDEHVAQALSPFPATRSHFRTQASLSFGRLAITSTDFIYPDVASSLLCSSL